MLSRPYTLSLIGFIFAGFSCKAHRPPAAPPLVSRNTGICPIYLTSSTRSSSSFSFFYSPRASASCVALKTWWSPPSSNCFFRFVLFCASFCCCAVRYLALSASRAPPHSICFFSFVLIAPYDLVILKTPTIVNVTMIDR